MAEEILVNHGALESRVALLSQGATCEVFIERHQKLGMVGNVYLGTVVRVLAGMQAAFVDIGEMRTAFLHIDDMQKSPKNAGTRVEKTSDANLPVDANLPIQYRLRQGERILVQVIKEPIGDKGARLSSKISLPSRYLVYLPEDDAPIGISQRIEDGAMRIRLQQDLRAMMQMANASGSLVVRTAAESADASKLKSDINYLLQLWQSILAQKKSAMGKKNAALLYRELSLPLRCLRDLVNENTQKIIVDDAEMFRAMHQFAKALMPETAPMMVHFTKEQPLFECYGVEHDLAQALGRRVDLQSGGYLVIDQTEAMTTIDVNTGAFVGGHSLENTAYKTNLEAAHVIARQLRLRNLGGIIILDFIDMKQEKHRQSVLKCLEQQLALDSAKTSIIKHSELGLVQMTRKRTHASLSQQLCEPCHTCQGRGYLKSSETVCLEIFRKLMRCARTGSHQKTITVIAHANVIDRLSTSEADVMAQLANMLARNIVFKVETNYSQEQYHIVLE